MEVTEKAVVLNENDNVATALADLEAGSSVTVDVAGAMVTIQLTSAIPFGHKFSLACIDNGRPVIKYGESIGNASTSIGVGDYVHIHNVSSTRGGTGNPGGAQ